MIQPMSMSFAAQTGFHRCSRASSLITRQLWMKGREEGDRADRREYTAQVWMLGWEGVEERKRETGGEAEVRATGGEGKEKWKGKRTKEEEWALRISSYSGQILADVKLLQRNSEYPPKHRSWKTDPRASGNRSSYRIYRGNNNNKSLSKQNKWHPNAIFK